MTWHDERAEVEVEVEVQATLFSLPPQLSSTLETASQHTLDFGGPPYVDDDVATGI